MNVTIVLGALVTLVWVVVIGLFILVLVRISRGLKVGGMSTAIIILAIIAILLSTVNAGLVFVPPDQRGVVISAVEAGGYRENALQPGLNWIVPFMENVISYSISRQTYTMSVISDESMVQRDDAILARTADGQEVSVDASVIYAIDPDQVVKVHIEWQGRYSDELVRPLTRGIIRDAIAQYGVEEVYSTKRAEMTSEIQNVMQQKLQDNGLLLVEFILRNISFSPEYAASVEQKQIAEQLAQQAKFVVEQKKQEAEQARQTAQGAADAAVIAAKGAADARVIQAKAEMQSYELIAQVLASNPALIQYLYIMKINPNMEVMMVPNNLNYFMPIPGITTSSTLTTDASVIPLPTVPITTTP